jgi:hypothetical protein
MFIQGQNINLDNLTNQQLVGFDEDVEVAILRPKAPANIPQHLLGPTDEIIFLAAEACSTAPQMLENLTSLQELNYGVLLAKDQQHISINYTAQNLLDLVETNSPLHIIGCCIPSTRLAEITELLRAEEAPITHLNICLSLLILTSLEDSGCMLKFSKSSSSAQHQLSRSEKALFLRLMLQSCNIEEIFPALTWDDSPEESATSAYHDLAAALLKFGDTTAALQCLEISDQFKESPRSFVMRGVIASQKGDTLAAVANIVSSLQQYEQIGSKNSLRDNLEISITECLQKGLEALNNHDNLLAYTKFAEAINTYDNYFEQKGIVDLYLPESQES